MFSDFYLVVKNLKFFCCCSYISFLWLALLHDCINYFLLINLFFVAADEDICQTWPTGDILKF